MPADFREAEGIIERVTPRLQHANSAVVLSAVKVIMTFLEKVLDADTERSLSRKMAPPLKCPAILANEIKVFFCKYNDPIYVKMEKLEIIIRLVSERNIEQVLLEFKEYATEVDVEFVRRSVRASGRCAVKLERAAEKCINVLLELIQTKVNYIVQEAIIVIKDIFRKYPNQYESTIANSMREPGYTGRARGEGIDDLDYWRVCRAYRQCDELLESFMDSFDDEAVQKVLCKATEESDNPDLQKPVISDDTCALEPSVLDELTGKISRLASVYHKLPSAFVMHSTITETEDGQIGQQAGDPVGLLDMGDFTLGDPPSIAPDPVAATSASASLVDIFGGPAAPPAPVAVNGGAVQKKLLMDAQQGKGLSSAPITGVSIQFNKSTFGVVPMQASITLPQPLAPGQTVNQVVPMSVSPQFVNAAVIPNLNLQVAIKNNSSGDVVYFQSELDLSAVFTEAGSMASTEFISMWQGIAEANEHYFTLVTGGCGVDDVSGRLGHNNVFYVAKRRIDGKEIAYFSVKTMTNVVALFELTFDNTGAMKVCLKLEQNAFSTLMQQTMERLLA
ncbi:unnamed protein product [Peronospora destructor]|uniref:Beta-adaptin appendage C-terminal subdomain domain-containing protein n=1 Tax=Peronospora destructor TaxID=86335 RepID=A0AAV0UBT4_9STRA|nr:unnamed protein product [Peronospora destructor]